MIRDKINTKLITNVLFWVYAAFLLVTTFVRIAEISFWGDECYSLWLAKMSIPDMLAETASDVHPPLHYFWVMLFYKIFGESPIMYHVSSVIPYVGIMLFGLIPIRKKFGLGTSTVFVTLATLMEAALRYNLEVRMYSLAAMLVLFAFYCVYLILNNNKWSEWIWFAIFSLAAAYTHYYALISVAFFYVVLILYSFKHKECRVKAAVISGATVVIYLPWLLVLLETFKRASGDFWVPAVQTWAECFEFAFDSVWLFVCFVVAVVWFVVADYREEKKVSKTTLWCMAGVLSFVGTAAVGRFVSIVFRPLFMVRYLFPIVIVVWLVFAISVSKIKFYNWVALLLTIAVFATHWPAYTAVCAYEKEMDGFTQDFLNNVVIEGESKIYTNQEHYEWTILRYYYPNCESVLHVNDMEYAETITDGEWVFQTMPMSTACLSTISARGYNVIPVYQGVMAVESWIFVYYITAS